MAAGNRGAGPGTHTGNKTVRTMNAPFNKAAGARTGSSSGIDGRNKAPFDKPQSMGGGSIPTRFFDTSMAARSASTVNAGMSKPTASANPNVGNRRFK